MRKWSLMKKLIWLRGAVAKGASFVWQTVTGSLPLAMTNAVEKAIKSLVQYGKSVQSETPTPSSPQDIVINNGVVRFGALGRNLCDPSAANTVLEYYINKADGEEKQSPYNFMFANYMPVEGGKTYVAYGRAKTGNDLSDYNRVAWYDSTKTWISGADYTQNRIAVVTAPSNAAYARFSCNPSGGTTVAVTQDIVDSYNWMFAEGNAEITPFVPFEGGILVDGTDEVLTVGEQTASVVNLFSVGDYADEHDLVSGSVTHKVGIKVLDGTETGWALSDSGSTHRFRGTKPSDCHTPASRAPTVCTHFKYVSTGSPVGGMFVGASQYWYFIPEDQTIETADAWKSWLAEQYANGTPVIVLYPLATQTTESVTAQDLTTAQGDNTVSAVSNVDPVTVAVEYAEAVST